MQAFRTLFGFKPQQSEKRIRYLEKSTKYIASNSGKITDITSDEITPNQILTHDYSMFEDFLVHFPSTLELQKAFMFELTFLREAEGVDFICNTLDKIIIPSIIDSKSRNYTGKPLNLYKLNQTMASLYSITRYWMFNVLSHMKIMNLDLQDKLFEHDDSESLEKTDLSCLDQLMEAKYNEHIFMKLRRDYDTLHHIDKMVGTYTDILFNTQVNRFFDKSVIIRENIKKHDQFDAIFIEDHTDSMLCDISVQDNIDFIKWLETLNDDISVSTENIDSDIETEDEETVDTNTESDTESESESDYSDDTIDSESDVTNTDTDNDTVTETNSTDDNEYSESESDTEDSIYDDTDSTFDSDDEYRYNIDTDDESDLYIHKAYHHV